MKIYIINLKRSVERRLAITTQCDALGLDYEVIEAVDGRIFSPEELKLHTAEINYAYRPGEIGCALSHLRIYEKIVEDSLNAALVLEDDALLSTNLSSIIEAVISLNNASCPMVTLLTPVNRLIDKPMALGVYGAKIYPVYHATTSHGYIINNLAAKNLLENLYPVWITADKWAVFEDYSFIKVQAVFPPPVTLAEEALVSTIVEDVDTQLFKNERQQAWQKIMRRRPLKVKLKSRLKRIFLPIFYKIITVKNLKGNRL